MVQTHRQQTAIEIHALRHQKLLQRTEGDNLPFKKITLLYSNKECWVKKGELVRRDNGSFRRCRGVRTGRMLHLAQIKSKTQKRDIGLYRKDGLFHRARK